MSSFITAELLFKMFGNFTTVVGIGVCSVTRGSAGQSLARLDWLIRMRSPEWEVELG